MYISESLLHQNNCWESTSETRSFCTNSFAWRVRSGLVSWNGSHNFWLIVRQRNISNCTCTRRQWWQFTAVRFWCPWLGECERPYPPLHSEPHRNGVQLHELAYITFFVCPTAKSLETPCTAPWTWFTSIELWKQRPVHFCFVVHCNNFAFLTAGWLAHHLHESLVITLKTIKTQRRHVQSWSKYVTSAPLNTSI